MKKRSVIMSPRNLISTIKADAIRLLTPRKIISIILGTAILSFGLHNIHKQTAITEGGVLGLVLLLDHWFHIPPAISSPALDILCYLLAFKFLGKDFIKLSLVSSLSLSGFFYLWEQLPYMIPDLSAYPFAAAVAGGVFVGVGVGLVVRQGISTGGDDALALTISKLTRKRISYAYFFTDFTVLMLSLTYIPLRRVGFSIITVLISSALIDFIKEFSLRKKVNTA